MKNTTKLLALTCVCLPAMASAQDWSGPYAGGSLALGSSELEVFDSGEFSAFGYVPVHGLVAAVSGRVGYNYQMGQLVYGPELSLGLAAMDESVEFDFCSPTTVENEIEGIASLRGRIGFAIDDVLIFGTAGAAYLSGKSEISCDTSYTDSVDGAFAFVVGMGAEYLYSDTLSISFEYLAIRGDDETVQAADAEDDENYIFGFKTDADLFSVGLNYHF